MDLRAFYRRIREFEESLPDEFVIVKSLLTEAGGRAGRLTEVSRSVAARLLAEGHAERASDEESAAFRKQVVESQAAEAERRQAAQVQFHVISESELGALRKPRTRSKD